MTLASGLTTSGQVAGWVIGGAESQGRNRKAFHFDRINSVRVLSGDGASMTVITSPPADWTGANQPAGLAIHQGAMFGGGNGNAPHTLYASLVADHEDFLGTPYSLLIGPEPGEEYIAALLSYKGGLLIWKYPKGVYFLDTSDPTRANWRALKVGTAGAAGWGCVVAAEDDVPWVAPDGSWHLISATQVTGSVRAEDLTARKLGGFFREQIATIQLASAQMIYYSDKLEIMLACHALGGTAKSRRIHMVLNQKGEVGENWIYWDRDRNEALFLRKRSQVYVPAMGDNAGQLWELDRPTRAANGAAYTFEWWMADLDFSQVIPQWAGKWKNNRFIQVEYDPRGGAVTHAIEVYHDGALKQTITFSLTAGQNTLPQTLPFTLGAQGLALTRPRSLKGRWRRIALRGRTTVVNQDVSIARVLIGAESGN